MFRGAEPTGRCDNRNAALLLIRSEYRGKVAGYRNTMGETPMPRWKVRRSDRMGLRLRRRRLDCRAMGIRCAGAAALIVWVAWLLGAGSGDAEGERPTVVASPEAALSKEKTRE